MFLIYLCLFYNIFLINPSQFVCFFFYPAPSFDEMHVWNLHFFHFLTPKIPVPIKRIGFTVTEKNFCIVCFSHFLIVAFCIPPPPPNNCRILKIRKFEMLFIGLECSCFPCLFHNMQLIELYGRNNTKILQRQVYPRKGKRFGRRIQVPPLIP